jgi:hypothetical protein
MSRLAASKLWLLLPQLPLFKKDGGIKQISKISSSRQKSFSHRKEASNVWPSMPKLQRKLFLQSLYQWVCRPTFLGGGARGSQIFWGNEREMEPQETTCKNEILFYWMSMYVFGTFFNGCFEKRVQTDKFAIC